MKAAAAAPRPAGTRPAPDIAQCDQLLTPAPGTEIRES